MNVNYLFSEMWSFIKTVDNNINVKQRTRHEKINIETYIFEKIEIFNL